MLGNMKIGMKLALGFGLVLVLTGALAFIGMRGMSVLDRNVELVDDSNSIIIDTLRTRLAVDDYAATKSAEAEEQVKKNAGNVKAMIEELRTDLDGTDDAVQLGSALDKLSSYLNNFELFGEKHDFALPLFQVALDELGPVRLPGYGAIQPPVKPQIRAMGKTGHL